jgi:single-strand DNA-binding protein
MLNKVFLLGSLGKDPESRYFPSGDQQVTVSLATSKRWKDKQTGEKKEKTAWHNLVFNGGLAKVASEYLTKGSKVHIIGEIDYQEWESDGQKKYMTRILVTDMTMLGGKGDSQQQSKPAQNSAPPVDDDFEDIPF